MLSTIAERKGFTCDPAENDTKALEMITRADSFYDVIFLDSQMSNPVSYVF